MQQDKYNLSWNNYSNHLRGLLHEMMKSKELTDVTLVCDDKQQFKAHKIVLSACSSVFKSIINDLPQTSSVIYLRGIQHQEMESILEFMYLGEASFYQERMNEFLNVAKNLQIKDMSNNAKFDNESVPKEPNINLNNSEEEHIEIANSDSDRKNLEIEEINKNITEEPNVNSSDSHQESIEISNSFTDRKSTTTSNQNLEIKEETDYLDNENTDKVNLLDAEGLENDFDTVVKEKNSKSDSDDSTVDPFTRNIHNVGVKYTCNQCDYQTALQKTIRFHIQSEHEGMMYVCNQCDYQANYKGTLNRHIKYKHEGVKYACDQCQYQSPQQSHLTDHIRSKHEGVRYACDHCQYQSTRQRELRRHVQSKHLGEF